MIKDDNYYIDLAYKEALKAYDKDEIPVGVVIVKDNKIISKAHNLRDSKNIVTKHAEIIAIEKANKKLNNWRLIDCILYSTLEPCNMCKEVIKESKIKKIVYAVKNTNNQNSINQEYNQISNNKYINKCKNIIQNKFSELRNR